MELKEHNEKELLNPPMLNAEGYNRPTAGAGTMTAVHVRNGLYPRQVVGFVSLVCFCDRLPGGPGFPRGVRFRSFRALEICGGLPGPPLV